MANYKQVLHIAFTVQTNTGAYRLRSYQVTSDSHFQPLDTFNFAGNQRPIKLDFISIYQFGVLAVLFEHVEKKPRVEFVKNEQNDDLAVAHSNGADVFKFEVAIAKHSLY